MKSAVVYYFSGTGNTELVAEMVREELNLQQYSVDLVRMEDVLKRSADLNPQHYDLIGIGSPVIGFGLPNLTADFIRKLPKQAGKKTFIFRTAGGVAPVNYNASKPIIRMLSRRGYDVFQERLFAIGSNWIKKFDDDIVLELYAATRKKVGIMCREIAAGKRRTLKTSVGLRVQMEILMKISNGFFKFLGKDYVIDSSCTHCGLCVRNCPAGNISEKGGKIRFRSSCSACMRCVYSCPKNAVKLRFFSFFAIEGGYQIQRTLRQPQLGGYPSNRTIPPFFNGYIQDESL